MVPRSQKSSIMMKINIRRERRNMTREWFSITIVIGLATLLKIVGKTKKKQK